jgi:hypothetical protein
VDTGIGRSLWIAALALTACHSADTATSSDPSAAAGSSSTGYGSIGDAPAICQSYSDHVQMCGDEWHVQTYAAQAFGRCAADLSYSAGLGPACRAANEDYFACLSAIECAALEDPSLVCGDEREAKALACSGGSGDSSSSSSTG